LPLWSADAIRTAPEVLRSIHEDYTRAGARVAVANTFRADRLTLAQVGRAEETREFNRAALRLAREGVAAASPPHPVLVVGSMAPLADCYRPDLVPEARTLVVEHGVRAGHLIAAGAAAAWIETMNSIREARTALEAATAGNLPAAVSFVCNEEGNLLSGEPIEDAARAVEDLEPLAIMINCCAPAAATKALQRLLVSTARPVGVYANGYGQPGRKSGWSFRGGSGNRQFAREAMRWLESGAQLVGGCCGTTPKTIQRVAKLITLRS
jgi:S-methylmethionine-dependent homocysteine/selenocysteine methylase